MCREVPGFFKCFLLTAISAYAILCKHVAMAKAEKRKESPAEDSFLFYVGAIIRVIPVDVRGINKLLFEEEV